MPCDAKTCAAKPRFLLFIAKRVKALQQPGASKSKLRSFIHFTVLSGVQRSIASLT